MLYRFDSSKQCLVPLAATDASSAGVVEKNIEASLAKQPTTLFRSRQSSEAPVLIIRTSQPGAKMADVIALDSQGRLVLVECKRWRADRDTLAQLLDYASEYDDAPYERLSNDWQSGAGAGNSKTLLQAFQEFADDSTASEADIGKDQVLVVVAAGPGQGFQRISQYLGKHGVPVHFVGVQLYGSNEHDLDAQVEPIGLEPDETPEVVTADGVWFFNTDETHAQGATDRILEKGVAAIWGYPDGPATLEKGARPGDTVYAYQNKIGVVARGHVVDGEVYQAADGDSVFPQCHDGNEWHLKVEWVRIPNPPSNSEVREATKYGLPVRSTFCRLWKSRVKGYLARRSASG